jgi:hypothetical protein
VSVTLPDGFALGFATAETLDSSKLRSNTVSRAQEVGLVRVTRYGRTAGYVTSAQVLEGLTAQAAHLAEVRKELHAARPLLHAAARLGVAPEEAVAALLRSGRDELDVAALAELVADAADDRDAARAAREGMGVPEDDDMGLDEFAAELGFDAGELRAEVRAGRAEAIIATS